MANIEDRLKNLEKPLSYHKVVVGILAFCLMLAVAAHLDAQPKLPGLGTRPGSQQIDSRRLNQILERIEKRLTSLEKQRVSHQPAAPAMHQPGPSHGQASLESRVTALEQKISQQPAAPAANQASSSPDLTTIEARVAALENQAGSPQQAAPATHQTGSAVGELTCTKLTVVNSAGQTMVELSSGANSSYGTIRGGKAYFFAEDGTMVIKLHSNSGGSFYALNDGGQLGNVRLDVTPNGGRIMVGDATGLSKIVADWLD